MLVAAVLAACGSPTSAPSVVPALHGGVVAAGSDRGTADVVDRMTRWRTPDPDCVADVYGGIALVGDVAPAQGDETVLASFSQGVLVIGHDGALIASTAGFACAGSQDDLGAVEIVRTLDGDTLIAVVGTVGGHAASSTWLELLAVGDSPVLERRFEGELEIVDRDHTRSGDVTLIPGGLIYRRPGGPTSLWRLDREAHRYVESHTFDLGPARGDGVGLVD